MRYIDGEIYHDNWPRVRERGHLIGGQVAVGRKFYWGQSNYEMLIDSGKFGIQGSSDIIGQAFQTLTL